jgi:hypothetical protein
MGMYCGLYKVPSSEVDKLLKSSGLVTDRINSEPTDGSYLSLEKSWHGLHYLLTGSPWGGQLPLSFILTGGVEIGPDLDYGRARLLSADFVRDLDSSLSGLTVDELWKRFDPEQMSKEKIYPEIWDEPEEELRDEYGWYFNDLKSFVRDARSQDNSIIIVVV